MKRVSLICATIVLVISISSCTQTTHQGTAEKVELNDGQRWKANPETTNGIANMNAIVEKVENHHGDSVLINTSILLKEEFDLIFKNCTMTGPGHDQLHNYLLPMLGWMKRMKGEDQSSALVAFAEIESHLKEYSN